MVHNTKVPKLHISVHIFARLTYEEIVMTNAANFWAASCWMGTFDLKSNAESYYIVIQHLC